MLQFLYASDTPGASAGHDKEVVDMLAAAAASEIRSTAVNRRTQLSTAKRQQKKSMLNKSLPAIEKEFFPGIERPFWGDKPQFEDDNLGRYNIWTAQGSPKGIGKKDSDHSKTKKELKSLRLA